MNISISIISYPTPKKRKIQIHGDYKIKKVKEGCAIVKYTGTDTEVIIPDNINGLSVVSLGDGKYKPYPFSDYVFGDNETMKSVIIPASVKRIEQQAFVLCYPEAIHVSEDNQYYSSEDGVLFDKKKRELIRYPYDKKDKSYTVPDGVKKIRVRAFYGCKFENLILPDGLLRIEDEAVHECHNLKSILNYRKCSVLAEIIFINF